MPSATDISEDAAVPVNARTSELRVLSVIPGQSAGASMIFAKRQAQSLLREGVTNRNFFLATRTSPLGLLAGFRRFRGEIRQFRPHLVHAHFGTVTALFCAVATCLPLVITFRGSDLNPCPSMHWLHAAMGRLFSHLAAIRAQHIVCVSEQLRQRLSWRRHGIRVIPTGVDASVFYPRSRDETRQQLGWRAHDRIVLFNAGRTPAVKRLDLAQAAVEEARRLTGRIRLVVLDGDIDPGQLPLMMNAADCLLLTSDWEGSPTVVQEAMACNLPVVAVDVGDVRDRLCAVQPSAIVPRDTSALGRAIAQMLTPPRRSNGRWSASQLSLEALAPQLIEIYRAALGRQSVSIRPATSDFAIATHATHELRLGSPVVEGATTPRYLSRRGAA